jgi:hypothetical protein
LMLMTTRRYDADVAECIDRHMHGRVHFWAGQDSTSS